MQGISGTRNAKCNAGAAAAPVPVDRLRDTTALVSVLARWQASDAPPNASLHPTPYTLHPTPCIPHPTLAFQTRNRNAGAAAAPVPVVPH